MPWTYPPQFDLLVAPFALLPAGVAYLLFVTATLTIYLLTLRAIAGKNFAQIMVVMFPALAITVGCGQNGFLTGALIGLVCLNVERRQVLAGLALDAMVIKPHLALAAGVRSVIYGLILLAGAYGMLQSARMAAQFGNEADLADMDGKFAPAIGGFALMSLLVLLARLLRRGTQPAPALPQVAQAAE
ncbi:glycosyltransferase family 87 protein [Bradyrhizobium sp. RT10b]|uniref:glycosyltransferase family 87 protein n=1 Tax=Bradyrhizobium sp. RT10b TaxID=3156331 RepID=UPI0033948A88